MEPILTSTNYKPISSYDDIKDNIKPLTLNRAKNPSISYFASQAGYSQNYSGRTFLEHEYDLYEYGRIIDTEALVSRAFMKKKTLAFKQGFSVNSRNPENLEYVKRRIEEISYMSKMPFRKFVREIAQNLICFHNNYVVKVRKEKASSGKVRKYRGGVSIEPIAAWFNLPTESVQVKINDAGEPIRYRQYVSGRRYKEYPERNISHCYYNKRTGFTMGTPPLEPVKDDIVALRRIEESVETLIYKSLFPIIHMKVGTEKAPARTMRNGVSEVDAATSLLNSIEDNGGLVTSERIEIKAIGSESLALRVESYLDHFKKRVYAGLGMSGIDYGDGDTTGRATGEVLSASLSDSVIDYQTELEEFITRELFDELLLESGKYEFSYQIPEEERVFFELRHVSTEEKMTKETHALNMMNSGLLMKNEARLEIGREEVSEEEEKKTAEYLKMLYAADIEVDKAKRMAAFAPKPAGSTTSSSKGKVTSGGNQKAKKTKSDGSKNQTAAKVKQKTKDSVISVLTDYALNYSINIFALKAKRELTDYGILEMTFGIMDSSEYQDEGLSRELDSIIHDLIDKIDQNELNTIKIKALMSQAIDKMQVYINNVLNG